MYRPAKSVERCHIVRNESPLRIIIVLLISWGITTRPKSSILRTIPVAFIILSEFPFFFKALVNSETSQNIYIYENLLKLQPDHDIPVNGGSKPPPYRI